MMKRMMGLGFIASKRNFLTRTFEFIE